MPDTLKDLPADLATSNIIEPESKNRMPANNILLPVISCPMPNSSKPSFMSG